MISVKFTGIGLIRHAEITSADSGKNIDINGYKYPTTDDPEFTFHELTAHVIAPVFIGFVRETSHEYYLVYGIALGNIEWS